MGDLPDIGVLPGELHLDPKRAPIVKGNARPFAPGEYLLNPNGSWSSEISTTTQDPSFNNGLATTIPTLWLIDGKPTRVTEDDALELAKQSGLNFKGYKDMNEANKASQDREDAWQTIHPEQASRVAPLWNTMSTPAVKATQ